MRAVYEEVDIEEKTKIYMENLNKHIDERAIKVILDDLYEHGPIWNIIKKEGMMTIEKLINFFPEYEEEIEELSRTLACGCSLCVWNVLKSKYSLQLPERIDYTTWC